MERFAKERRVQILSQGYPHIMNDLIAFIVRTARGVFLWVKVVVHELLRAARDGATFTELVKTAHQIPGDLDSYFSRFIDSIPTEYREEASHLFQIMLHSEDAFRAVHGLRLLDLSYGGSVRSTPNSQGVYEFTTFDPDNIAKLNFRLDSTARRINSRSRGLIECYYLAGDIENSVGVLRTPETNKLDREALHLSPTHMRNLLESLTIFNHHVGLIHRSLRDFLLSPEVFHTVQAYLQCPFSTRLFSYVLSALATDELKFSNESALIAEQIKPIVESLGRAQLHKSADYWEWYLSSSFYECQTEYPDFLTVAIDFDLVAYLRKTLTAQAIHDKHGLSVLHCILFDRFWGNASVYIGNRFPNTEVLRLALELGVDPN